MNIIQAMGVIFPDEQITFEKSFTSLRGMVKKNGAIDLRERDYNLDLVEIPENTLELPLEDLEANGVGLLLKVGKMPLYIHCEPLRGGFYVREIEELLRMPPEALKMAVEMKLQFGGTIGYKMDKKKTVSWYNPVKAHKKTMIIKDLKF